MLPQPMSAERLAGQLDAHEAVLLPLAGLGRGVGLGHLAGQREHHARSACSAVVMALPNGRVHHHHAARGGGADVDVVDADAGAADHLQVRSPPPAPRASPWWRERIARPSYWPMIGAQLRLAEARLEVDLDAAVLEDLRRAARERACRLIENRSGMRHRELRWDCGGGLTRSTRAQLEPGQQRLDVARSRPWRRTRCAGPAARRDRWRRRSATPSLSSSEDSFFAAAACFVGIQRHEPGAVDLQA
jgi:hypothetical protein